MISLGEKFDCFVQYWISTIQNSVWHTVSAYISQFPWMLCYIKKKKEKKKKEFQGL